MYAVIETGGKQYKVIAGDTIYVEKLGIVPNESITFDKVIAVNDDTQLIVGKPYVKDVTVSATARKEVKGQKITVFTYKPKKNEKRKLGHRQPYTRVTIDSINIGSFDIESTDD